MKHLKIYESYDSNSKLEIGDYVILKYIHSRYKYIEELNTFLQENVGRIQDIIQHLENDMIVISFNIPVSKIPVNIKPNFNKNEIQFYMKNIEMLYKSKKLQDCTDMIRAMKYNI